MRKLLLTAALLAGGTLLSPTPGVAAPAASLLPLASPAATVQTVQYYHPRRGYYHRYYRHHRRYYRR